MSTTTLYSFSALAGIIAGICIILGTVLTDLVKTSKGTVFNFLGALIGLFGITGFYLWQADQAGIFGFVAYILVFIGLALIACNDYFGAFISPSLPPEDLTQLSISPAMRFIYISYFVFLVGEILFGVSTIMAGIFPQITAVLFVIGFFATPLRSANRIITFIGLSLSGIGLIWWSVSLWLLSGGS